MTNENKGGVVEKRYVYVLCFILQGTKHRQDGIVHTV